MKLWATNIIKIMDPVTGLLQKEEGGKAEKGGQEETKGGEKENGGGMKRHNQAGIECVISQFSHPSLFLMELVTSDGKTPGSFLIFDFLP